MKIKSDVFFLSNTKNFYKKDSCLGYSVFCSSIVKAVLGYIPNRVLAEVSTSPLKGGFSVVWDVKNGVVKPSQNLRAKRLAVGPEQEDSYFLMGYTRKLLGDILQDGKRFYIRFTEVKA